MHLMIPHASALGEACEQALQTLALPHLATLLGRLQPEPPLGGDELSLLTPAEQALARLWGWTPTDTAFAAAQAEDEGLATAGRAWALLTPLHLSVSADQITAMHPDALALDEAESRTLFDALAQLFAADEGWTRHWAAPQRWYVSHEALAGLATASLDRVVNRSVLPWAPEPRLLRQLQNEMQMLLHREPVNAAREARGALPVNSVWISGCGLAQARRTDAALQLEQRLREPLLAEDWAGWREAWQALDAGPVKALLERHRAGEPVAITLAGERSAQRWLAKPRRGIAGLWQRLSAPRADVAQVLAEL